MKKCFFGLTAILLLLILMDDNAYLEKRRAYYWYTQNSPTTPEIPSLTPEYSDINPSNLIEAPEYSDINPSNLIEAPKYSVIPEKLPTISGGGEPGYAINLLQILDHTAPLSPTARLKRELIALYYKAFKGELDTAQYHLTPGTYAAIHKNESNSATFLDSIYENGSGRYLDSDMTLARFTGEMWRTLNKPGSNVVNVDNGGDGLPDGPFQIEKGNADKIRASNLQGFSHILDRNFDVVFFPDNLAWMNHDFSNLVEEYGISGGSPEEMAMFSSFKHNRGSVHFQAFGIPYNTQRAVDYSSYVRADKTQIYQQARALPKDLISTYNKYRPSVPDISNNGQNALGILLCLKAGWYIDSDIGTIRSRLITPAAQSIFSQLFPEASETDMISYIIDNFVRTPWGIIGITKEEYGKIYGMTRNSYQDYYRFTSMFKVEDYTSSCYINKMPNGSDPPVIHVWDHLPIGHAVGTGLIGEHILLELLLEAGLPQDLGNNVIDPTNPSLLYNHFQTSSGSKSYDPRITNSGETESNFNTLLSLLQISVTYEQSLVLYHTYEASGHYYYYGGGGYPTNSKYYGKHLAFASLNNGVGKAPSGYLNQVLYSTLDGSGYNNSTPDSNLAYRDKRLYDCTKLVLAGLSLGQTKGDLVLWSDFTSTDVFRSLPQPRNTRITPYNGKNYDVGLDLVSSGGTHDVNFYKTNWNDTSLIEGGLQPGDIMVKEGHIFTVLCVAQNNVIIPSKIARRDVDVSVKRGDIVTIEAWGSGHINGVKVTNTGKGYKIARPYMYTQ